MFSAAARPFSRRFPARFAHPLFQLPIGRDGSFFPRAFDREGDAVCVMKMSAAAARRGNREARHKKNGAPSTGRVHPSRARSAHRGGRGRNHGSGRVRRFLGSETDR